MGRYTVLVKLDRPLTDAEVALLAEGWRRNLHDPTRLTRNALEVSGLREAATFAQDVVAQITRDCPATIVSAQITYSLSPVPGAS